MSSGYTQQWIFRKVKTYSELLQNNIEEVETSLLGTLRQQKEHPQHEDVSIALWHYIRPIIEDVNKMVVWANEALELERWNYTQGEYASILSIVEDTIHNVSGLKTKYVNFSRPGNILHGSEDLMDNFPEFQVDLFKIESHFARSEKMAQGVKP